MTEKPNKSTIPVGREEKEKRIVGKHTFTCSICSEMAKRGYKDEADYWDDFFDHKEKPIKYKLILDKNKL